MGLVRSVFTKSRSSVQRQHSYGRNNNNAEKKRWKKSVRSYLCGDHEHNSILAAADDSTSFRSNLNYELDHNEVDNLAASFTSTNTNTSTCGGRVGGDTSVEVEETTTSVKSCSEATVNQPASELINEDQYLKDEKQNSAYKLFQQDDAAFIIQSAFRSFRARRRARNEKKMEGDHDENYNKIKGSTNSSSPSRESIATSIEVQTGNSHQDIIFSDVCHQMRHKTRSQVLKLQEEWDDSTVSSVISKMRIQNRVEAATRRERALAYAFSQQLRICSKKKQSATNSNETNIGWNWLERWMAVRQPAEIMLMEDQISCSNQTRKRLLMLDSAAAIEEKESCGSNEVSSLVELNINNNVSVPKNIIVPRPVKIRNKVTPTSLPRQNSATSHLCPTESNCKDMKKVCNNVEDDKDKRKRPKHPAGNKRTYSNISNIGA